MGISFCLQNKYKMHFLSLLLVWPLPTQTQRRLTVLLRLPPSVSLKLEVHGTPVKTGQVLMRSCLVWRILLELLTAGTASVPFCHSYHFVHNTTKWHGK